MLALISILGVYPSDPLYYDEVESFVLFTMPVSFFGSGYRLICAEPIYPVFIIQAVVLVISLLITNFITREKK